MTKTKTNFRETGSFEFADRRITRLLENLKAKGVCGCCTGRALLFHGASLLEVTMGTAEAAETLERIVAAMGEHPAVPAPDRDAQMH